MFKNWSDSLTKKYTELSLESKFKFSCHKGISCYNQCCSNVNIFLSPYDVLRMRKALGLSSGEFLGKFTVPLLSTQKVSMVLLKMNDDEGKTCPFVGTEGCTIYNDRPWPCRMYPIGVNTDIENAKDTEKYCFLAEEGGSLCLGTKEEKEWTVAEWFKNQGIDLYNKKAEAYKAITLHPLLRDGQNLTDAKAQMFYVALYDLDRFRGLIFESSFFYRFDIEKRVMEKIKVDDGALLDFGAKWLRFSLFGENTLRIKGEMGEEREPRKRQS